MLSTPDFGHLKAADYEQIYEAAEDTFLFLDALEGDMEAVLRPRQPAVCLEVGSGSGCVSTFLAMHLGKPIYYLTTDINPAACAATRGTAVQNRVQIDAVHTDLVSSLLPRLAGSVDVFLFNPPYVPTPDGEVGTPDLSAAWAGGERGRRVIDRLLPQIPVLLSARGVAYFVLVQENDPDEIARTMAGHGLAMSVVMRRRSGPERLMIVRFERV
ncbi:S-adenosylmethionine-dependent methyltransferase [Blastocladiella emersonii ATCC 22665]|nr:S-adenosylmethionine-dependent methyltransferase [Blastocladiella emersonii ATCC 22665]